MPNRGQAYRSSDATATWHLEYKVGDGSYLPDPTSTIVTGSGTSQVWPSNQHDCTSGSPAYTPNVSILKQTGSGNTFTLTSPFMGDLVDKTGSCLSYTKAWYSSCGTGSTGCPDLAAFWTASFTIAPGQAGTVVTQIPKRHLDYINNQPTLGGDHAVDSWSGTITVIAL